MSGSRAQLTSDAQGKREDAGGQARERADRNLRRRAEARPLKRARSMIGWPVIVVQAQQRRWASEEAV